MRAGDDLYCRAGGAGPHADCRVSSARSAAGWARLAPWRATSSNQLETEINIDELNRMTDIRSKRSQHRGAVGAIPGIQRAT